MSAPPPPTATIIPGGILPNTPTLTLGPTFTGTVYLERIHSGSGLSMGTVTFTPCSRTYWHTHETGQLLQVVQGIGWICDKGAEAKRIKKGDVVWCPAGTVHWHGADEGSLLTHTAMGLGETKWLDEVSEEEYRKRES